MTSTSVGQDSALLIVSWHYTCISQDCCYRTSESRLLSSQMVKPVWILLKQETVSGSGISWAMQVCTSLQRDNHASTPPLSFFTGQMPFHCPTNSVKALKAIRTEKSGAASIWNISRAGTRHSSSSARGDISPASPDE